MNATFDFLLVGQGLAGSLLAWELRKRGRSLQLVDAGDHGGSSEVAAGMVNPLAGMRFNLPARIEAYLQAMHRSLDELDTQLGAPALVALPMLRLLRSPEQRRFLDRQLHNPDAAPYLGDYQAPGSSGQRVNDPFGSFTQRQTGYLPTSAWLGTLRDWLADAGLLVEQRLDHAALTRSEDGWRWHGDTYTQVVFCEGWQVMHNPWFGGQPWAPDRGDILTLRSTEPLPEVIVNGAHWLIPLGDGRYRCGATHGHHDQSLAPRAEDAETLSAGLSALLGHTPGVEIIDHQCGIRPTTRDRRPIVGRHREEPGLICCNGFGARGVMTIPWHIQRLAEHLCDGTPLPADIQPRHEH